MIPYLRNASLTQDQKNIVQNWAVRCVKEKNFDAETNPKANWGNGNPNDSRTPKTQSKDFMVGMTGEFMICVDSGQCSESGEDWSPNSRQYETGKNDIILKTTEIYSKSLKITIPCPAKVIEVRATATQNGCIIRLARDKNNTPNIVMGAVSMNYQIFYEKLERLCELAEAHPEWIKTNDNGPPFHVVPWENFTYRPEETIHPKKVDLASSFHQRLIAENLARKKNY